MNRLVSAAAVTYAGIGVAAMARPSMVPALFGGRAETPDSRSEIRAVYGGLPLAIAGLLASSPSSAVPMGVLSAGMAAGRSASVALERGEVSVVTKAFIGLEAALAVSLLIGGRARRA